jgi:hypothetical protein
MKRFRITGLTGSLLLGAAFILLATGPLSGQEPPPRARAVTPTPPLSRTASGVDIVAVNVVPTNFLAHQPVIAGQATKLQCVVYEYHPEGTDPAPVPWQGSIEAEGKVLATFSSQAANLSEHLFDGNTTMTSWAYDYEADWTPTKAGWRETACTVDVANAVPESNEGNNTKTSKAWVEGPRTARLGVEPPPTAQLPPGGPLVVAPARLATKSATIVPAQPHAGQKIEVVAQVENDGGQPSQAGAGVFGLCFQVPENPPCPPPSDLAPFADPLPILDPGQTETVTLSPPALWKAGKYQLRVGTDIVGGQDVLELELVVKPSTYGPVPMRESPIQQQTQPGESQGLNPQPEPPSAEARAQGNPPQARMSPPPPTPAPDDLVLEASGQPALHVPKPDLVITGVTGNHVEGGGDGQLQWQFWVEVTNHGPMDAGGGFLCGAHEVALVPSASKSPIPKLASHQSAKVQYFYGKPTWWFVEGGALSADAVRKPLPLFFVADCQNGVEEANESNNQYPIWLYWDPTETKTWEPAL